MSRSRKRTPVHGNTTCESEKADKRLNNRRLRRRTRTAMDRGEFDVMPVANEVSNRWLMGKDGKTRFDPSERPHLMRK